MTIFDHPLWPALQIYARLGDRRANVDLLQLPDDLREQALAIALPCVACGNTVHVFRKRAQSERSRIAGCKEERRLFYAATCPEPHGCSRTKAAKDWKKAVKARLSGQSEPVAAITVEVHDASGVVLLRRGSEVRERVEMRLPRGAATIVLVPRTK